MDLSTFLTSVGTSFAIFIVLMFLFTWLSRKPGNVCIYYPNRILKGLDPWEEGRSRTRNPFAWIREAFGASEEDIIAISGVDSAVYFVFVTTVFGILVISGIFLLPVLLPLAYTDRGALQNKNTTTSNGTFNDLDRLSMGHIKENGPRLWAFVVACYWVSFVAYCLLWKAYKHVSDLRAKALMSPEVKAEQFAILVRDIPSPTEGQTIKEQVETYFKTIYPDTYYRSMVVTDNKEVEKIYKELEGYKKKLSKAEIIYEESKKDGNTEGTRPTNKTGFLGIFGKTVDSIDYYGEKISELTPKLEAERKVTLREKQKSAALIFFTNRVSAASAAQSLHAPMVDTWTVMDAPEPRQVLWSNLPKKYYEREVRQYVVYFIVFVTILFYMIPISLVSAFTTLPNLRKMLPFLRPLVDQNAVKTTLQAFLPQIALIVFLALLPKFLLSLSKAEGIPTRSHAIRAASGKYFYFSVLNVFIGVTLSGTLFDTFKSIQKDPNSVVDLLATSLPSRATFFLTFVALRFFVGYGLELSRIIPLIIFHVKKKFLLKTEDEVKEAWYPGDIGYGTRVPGDLLIVTVVLCYSVIAPLIIPFGALYFGLAYLIFRNQVLKVYVPSYESNGRMWPHIHTRILAALILFQVTMLGYFGVKKFYFTPIIIPLPILSFIFAFVCNKKFYRFFQSTALEVVSRQLKEIPNMEHVFAAFVPASLSEDKSDGLGGEKGDNVHFEDAVTLASRTGGAV